MVESQDEDDAPRKPRPYKGEHGGGKLKVGWTGLCYGFGESGHFARECDAPSSQSGPGADRSDGCGWEDAPDPGSGRKLVQQRWFRSL